jgi:isoamylase
MSNGAVFGSRILPDKSHVGFTLWSPRATRVELWIYAAPLDANPISKTVMISQADQTLACKVSTADLRVAMLEDAIYYGYRAWGPNWTFDPAWTPGSSAGFISDVNNAGDRFNPNKLLLDPYALEVSHNPLTSGHPDPTAYLSGASSRTIDTAHLLPKASLSNCQTLTSARSRREPSRTTSSMKFISGG